MKYSVDTAEYIIVYILYIVYITNTKLAQFIEYISLH